jgi:hypothetical protein
MDELANPKRTRVVIRSNMGLKNRHSAFKAIHVILLVYILLFSMVNGSFNFYYFFMNIFKVISFIVVIYTMVYVLFDEHEILAKWNEKKDRHKVFTGKWLYALIQSAIVFVPSCIILLIINLSNFASSLENNFLLDNPGALSPFSYTPDIIEGILIGLIILLSLLMIFTAPYWSVARFFTIIGYLHPKKTVKVKSKPFIFALLFQMFPLILFTIVLDGMFVEIRHGDIYNHWGNLFTLLEGRAYIVLLIQMSLLLIMNLVYFLDGRRLMKKRENFIELEEINVERSY